MIGLGLCRIGVGMAGVVLSYRVTLNMAALPAMYTIPVPLETAEASRARRYPDIKGFSALFMQLWSPSPPT